MSSYTIPIVVQLLVDLYRGHLVNVVIQRPETMTVKDLISNKVTKVHTSRLRPFRHATNMGIEETLPRK